MSANPWYGLVLNHVIISFDLVVFKVETKHFVTESYKSMIKFQQGGLGFHGLT